MRGYEGPRRPAKLSSLLSEQPSFCSSSSKGLDLPVVGSSLYKKSRFKDAFLDH